VPPVYAAPITVTNTNDSGAGSLRQAITNAAPGDTITFDSPLSGQTIILASTLVINKNLTIDGSSLFSKISISGNNSVRVFSVSASVIVEIDSLIIKNGRVFETNGAGIYNAGTLTITDSVFSANNAVVNPYAVGIGEGSAIYNQGDLAILRSTFNNNTASRGGAISCYAGAMLVSDSTFLSNSAVSDAAGAIFDYCDSLIINSTFSSNTAATSGGAVLTDNDINPIGIVNSTFHNNTALSGGGIANYGELSVNNSTFSNNNASNGGALRNGLGGVLSLANSILANSVGGVDCNKSDGAPDIENINNLIESTSPSLESCGTSLLTSDPMLGPLQDNGGFTKTMALLPGSPAINTGDDATCQANDQRGVTRPEGTHCDIGAYEYTSPTFSDVPQDQWARSYIERLYGAGITQGCSINPLRYCPENIVTRDQMAIFLLRGIHGAAYTPPNVAGNTGFDDVPPDHWAAAWIKQLAAEGITSGCGSSNYCPDFAVTRDQMAVFLLRAKHGSGYTPPEGTGIFGDVPDGYWTEDWIEQLAEEGITSGCGSGNYCPTVPVTRDQMAVFMVRTFSLP
jgi:predicted outer membrane repeat protein